MLRADNLATFMCRLSQNLGASTSWNPLRLQAYMGITSPYLTLRYFTETLHAFLFRNIYAVYFTILYTILYMLYTQSIFSFDLSAVKIIPFRRIFCVFVFLLCVCVCNILLDGENSAYRRLIV